MHTFYFKPGDGKYNFEDVIGVQSLPNKLRDIRHVMEIKEVRATRTKGANAYYWAVVIPYFMEEMGLIDSESNRQYMHYDVLGKELRQIPDPNRPDKTMTQQTHTMNGSQFWKYINKCGVLFYEMYGGNFPPPHGYDKTKA